MLMLIEQILCLVELTNVVVDGAVSVSDGID
jgi:hypothetical protein